MSSSRGVFFVPWSQEFHIQYNLRILVVIQCILSHDIYFSFTFTSALMLISDLPGRETVSLVHRLPLRSGSSRPAPRGDVGKRNQHLSQGSSQWPWLCFHTLKIPRLMMIQPGSSLTLTIYTHHVCRRCTDVSIISYPLNIRVNANVWKLDIQLLSPLRAGRSWTRYLVSLRRTKCVAWDGVLRFTDYAR
jgi:hypothetical protein